MNMDPVMAVNEVNRMDWTERVWRGLAWVRTVAAIGLWLYLIVQLMKEMVGDAGGFAQYPLYGKCLVTVVFVICFAFGAVWVWTLVWCGSLLLMPPRFFSKSDSGKRLLKDVPAWTWRIIAITFIALTYLASLVD